MVGGGLQGGVFQLTIPSFLFSIYCVILDSSCTAGKNSLSFGQDSTHEVCCCGVYGMAGFAVAFGCICDQMESQLIRPVVLLQCSLKQSYILMTSVD